MAALLTGPPPGATVRLIVQPHAPTSVLLAIVVTFQLSEAEMGSV
jgi:hypothetical protein